MALITFENVSYAYPLSESPVLKNLNFTVNEGELVGIVGANGAGKTTLCDALRGFVPHFYKGDFSGKVIVGQREINQLTNLSEIADTIGYVFQNPFSQMSGIEETVYEEIAFGLENMGIPRAEIKQRVEAVLTTLDLQAIRHANPFELSGGQQQKVALAAILAMSPKILIADEPTSQLDPVATAAIFSLLNDLKNQGTTLFLVEHKIDFLYQFASRILVIHNGEIVIDDKPTTAFLDERLGEYGVEMPKILELGLALQKKYHLETLPQTQEEINELLIYYGLKGRREDEK